MPHDPFSGPAGQTDFADQLRLNPGGLGAGFRRHFKRALLPDQRIQFIADFLQLFCPETASRETYVDQSALLENAQHEGTEMVSTTLRLGEPRNNPLLSETPFVQRPGRIRALLLRHDR